MIVIDPRRTRLARMADLHLQLRLGTDIPLVNAMLHAIFAHGWEARDYLAARCENVDALRAAVADVPPEWAPELTGVPVATIVEAARRYATTPHACLVYGLGVTQHVCGTENVIAYSNLALATGHVGVEGAGINPLRGQNNVQGACDMGALPDVLSGYQSVRAPAAPPAWLSGYQSVRNPAARAKFAAAWGVELHDRPGLTTLGMQRAAREGALRALGLCA